MQSMNGKTTTAVIWSLVLALLSGCGGSSNTVPSNTVPTASIYAYIKATQSEAGTVTTTVQLRDGSGPGANYLYLAGGDSLYSSLDTPPLQYLNFSGDIFGNAQQTSEELKVLSSRNVYVDYILFQQIVYGEPEYYSTATPTSGSATVRPYVEFLRAGNTAAGTSSIVLPSGFQITAPASDSSVTRATPVTLTWTNADPTTTMRLNVGTACDDGTQNSSSLNLGVDTGTTTLDNTIYLPATASALANCRFIYILERVKTGGVSPNFFFGTFEGIQQRTVQFTITP